MQEYIKHMIDTMQQAEDLESLENLHALCSCMQTICVFNILPNPLMRLTSDAVTLNDHTLFEHILDDDIFFGVVGMLECA